MRHIIDLLAAWGIAMFVASVALVAQAQTIATLPDKGAVTVSGTVAEVNDEREFILRDESGSIDVRMISNESAVLKPGDKVTVSGTVERPWWGLVGKNIAAGSVQVHKDIPTALSDALKETTGISIDRAEAVRIGELPAQGMVKVSGTVDQVSDEKNFTLKDSTGRVEVSIESDENVVLTNGAEVTVIGYVDSDILGKEIRATDVTVVSSLHGDASFNAN